jgi:hypothetical protein
METLSISDKQGMEICENVGRMLVEELDSGDVWNRVEQMLADYLKNNNINMDAADLTDKLEWSVKVKLKKNVFSLIRCPFFLAFRR